MDRIDGICQHMYDRVEVVLEALMSVVSTYLHDSAKRLCPSTSVCLISVCCEVY